jgi:glycine oxidase
MEVLECDVAVVGAGAIGGSIAYELAARGASVTVLDSRPAGLGATQAAAGMLVPYIEGFGKPILPMAARSLGMYDEFIDRLSADSTHCGMKIDYKRSGSLQVATADEAAAELKTVETAAHAAGVNCEFLDAAQVRELEPLLTPDVVAGLLIPEHGYVVPGTLSYVITAAAIKRGAKFTGDEHVFRIVAREGRFEVETSHYGVHARQVIVAAGCWSGQLKIPGVPALPVRPVRGQLVHVGSPSASWQRIIWGPDCYLAPSGSALLSVGATVEEAGFDERATVAGIRDLLDAATELVPALWKASYNGARVGLRPATPDELPIMGRSKALPGLVYATGHFRNGILLAPLTARVVADLILENREDEVLETTSPQRFGEY